MHIEGRVGPERGTAGAAAVLMVQLPSRQLVAWLRLNACTVSG